MLDRPDFRVYQEEMYERGMNSIASDTLNMCKWVGMGGGKTAVALTVAEDLWRYGECAKTLVVSTKAAARETWQHEHKKWSHLAHQGNETFFLDGTPSQRAAKLNEGRIHIISQNNLPWLVKGYKNNWPYDLVVIDDCKGLKKPSSETFKRLRQIRPFTTKMINMTGTPMPNGFIQLWPQIYLMDKGKRLGRTYTEYKNRWFYPDYNGWNWSLKSGAEEEIMSAVADVAYSVDPADHLELQIPEDFGVGFTLPPKICAQYKELQKEFYLLLKNGSEIEAVNQAVLQNKLSQLCNGAVYTDPLNEKSSYEIVHDLKLDLLADIISESQGENLIIAYNFKSDWDRIKKRFKNAVSVKDSGAVTKWNEGKIKLLCCHPGSAGHGLNLQHGGRTIVWFGGEWNLEYNLQMDERVGAVRQAQSGLNKKPRYIRIFAKNTVEEEIAKSLSAKEYDQNKLMDYVKVSL